MTISICMIVKNESETLDRCLTHARPFVDEIVIVDTGSTDGTQEIAKKYADVYDEIEWPNSFSDARNYSLGLVTSDYVMILDGDEYIPEASDWDKIRELIQSDDVASIRVRVRNLLRDDQLIAADQIIQDRIFRNHPLIRYDGAVHNQIESGIVAYVEQYGGQRLFTDAEIIHTGYALTNEQMKRKYAPRIKLLESEYYDAKTDQYRAYYGYQLGVALFILEEYDRAHAVFGELNYGVMSRNNAFYSHVLAGQISLKMSDPERALIHCNAMLSITREEPVAFYTTGLALLLAEMPGDGMLMLMGALDVIDERGANVRFQLNNKVLLDSIAGLYRRMGMAVQSELLLSVVDQHSGEVSFERLRGILHKLKLQIIEAEEQSQAIA